MSGTRTPPRTPSATTSATKPARKRTPSATKPTTTTAPKPTSAKPTASTRSPARRRGNTAPPARPRTRTVANPPRPGRSRRHVWMLTAVLLTLLGFTIRLAVVQGPGAAALAQEALDGRLVTVEIPADRGEVLDSNGVVLATSVERYNIVADQTQVAETNGGTDAAATAAAKLAPLLGLDPLELGAQLLGDRRFVYLVKDVPPDVYHQVMDLGVPGISGERTTERVYPSGATAGTLLGFVNSEDVGSAGIEQTYDDVLSGTTGHETYERGAHGQRIPNSTDERVDAVPGRDVQLTIDRDLQYVTQSAADAGQRTTGADWVTIEVLDVQTGEILALADSGSIDPNNPENANPSRAAAAIYDPGSTAKVITMAAILENNIASPTSQFNVPDTYAVPNGEVFHDSHSHDVEPLTLNGILAQSSNVGTVMVGQHLPTQTRLDYLAKFGFGATTGTGLPGESAGIVPSIESWNGDGRSPYTILFGQSVSVTTLQATQVFATLANGGVRVQPHLVQAVEDSDGVMQPVELDEPTQVVSTETADTLVRMLESVVTDGTGERARVPGYRIAGKTGTAQAWDNGVETTVASFIGIAPADDPRIVVNVTMYHPRSTIYGGSAAGPVFSQVTGYTLQYLGIAPSGEPADEFPITWK